MDGFSAKVLDHPLYSPALAPSNFHLFLHLKKYLTGKKFDNDEEVQEEVMTWFKDLINVWTMPATMLKNKVM
jgi:histone-lysine N-methyltransferase SETMAR